MHDSPAAQVVHASPPKPQFWSVKVVMQMPSAEQQPFAQVLSQALMGDGGEGEGDPPSEKGNCGPLSCVVASNASLASSVDAPSSPLAVWLESSPASLPPQATSASAIQDALPRG
jgi:hypothetical protein